MIRWAGIFLAVWFWIGPNASAKIAVGVLDFSIDLKNPSFSQFIDLPYLETLPYGDFPNLAAAHAERWRQSLEFYFTLHRPNEFDRWWSDFHHGDLVVDVLVNGLSSQKVTLIPIPHFTRPAGSRLPITYQSVMRGLNENAERGELRNLYDQATKVFRLAQVRVVNLSMGSAVEFSDETMEIVDMPSKPDYYFHRRREKYNRKLARLGYEERERFYRENPKIVFVSAAGNQNKLLSICDRKYSFNTACIKAPNTVVVQSNDPDGARSPNSNYGFGYVQIAALGTALVKSFRDNGREAMFRPSQNQCRLLLSGSTSLAAPRVTAALAELRDEHPDWSAPESIRELLSRASPVFQSR